MQIHKKTVDHACKCNRPNFTTLLVPSDLQRYTCILGTYKAIKDSITNIKATSKFYKSIYGTTLVMEIYTYFLNSLITILIDILLTLNILYCFRLMSLNQGIKCPQHRKYTPAFHPNLPH